ncbi:hypothetical protein [Roseimaritima multifibrata]|uniref:hypothetical protein n=1 Tax=Roseimaritima multifibrata TaxID=1930274 RepID=UPI001C54E055|nr:hypothetical protein [Roseimaritima multifibrata]
MVDPRFEHAQIGLCRLSSVAECSRGVEYEYRDAEYEYRDAEYEYRGAEYEYRGAEYEYRGAEYEYEYKYKYEKGRASEPGFEFTDGLRAFGAEGIVLRAQPGTRARTRIGAPLPVRRPTGFDFRVGVQFRAAC